LSLPEVFDMSKITRVLLLILVFGLLMCFVTACSSSGEITGIELSGNYRNVYVVGEDLDLTGMKLVVTNSDGSTSEVTLTDVREEVKFLNVDTNTVANQATITVEYKKQRTTFTIEVVRADADENRVNVIFDLNIPSLEAGEGVFEERKVLQLSKLDAPVSVPVRADYVTEDILYAFDGWYKNSALTNQWNFMVDQVVLTSDNANNTVYIYAKWTPYCKVTFIKLDALDTESLVATKLVKKGDAISDFPSIPISSGEEKYTFEWDISSTFIIKDTIIRTKKPVLKTYDVVFCDYINNVSQELYRLNDVPYGTNLLDPATVLTNAQDAQIHTLADIGALSPNNKDHYVFTNAWDYKNNTYTIANPAANSPLTDVKQDMQFYAHYQIEMFTAKYNINYPDGTNPPSLTVNYNTPILSVSVTREGYDFDGWYKDAECIRPWNFNTEKLTDDRTLYAKWTKLHIISFYALYIGDSVGQEKDPALDAGSLSRYQTSGIWTDTDGNSLSGLTLDETLTYIPGGYTYNYLRDGNAVMYTRVLITTLSVRNGETAQNLPSVSTNNVAVTGYTARWSSTSFTNITADREVFTIYTIMTFSIRFVDGATQIGVTQVIPYLGDAVAPDNTSDGNVAAKAIFDNHISTIRSGYNFIGWDAQDYLLVTGNKTISALFTPKTYRVTIQVVPGSLEVREPKYDTTLLLPTPVRSGYDFDGWYTTSDYLPESLWESDDKVYGNLSIYAKWVEIFSVTFTDDNIVTPVVLATRTVRKGSTLTDIPAVPQVVGKNGVWREDGAIPNFVNVQRNMVISASYTDKTFTINFKNGNYDNYYFLSNVLYNAKVSPPADPADPGQGEPDDGTLAVGYYFEGWSVGGVSGHVNFATYEIRQDTTFIADYSRRTFQVLFVDSDYDQTGTVFATRTVEYEAQAYPPANPSKEGMDFIGWASDKTATLPSPDDYKSVRGNMTVYALYRIKTYRITFKSLEDNFVWATVTVNHGSYVVYPTSSLTPTYTGYTFSRWDFNFSTPITSNRTIYAVYTINTYTVTFDVNGGSEIEPYQGDYNTYPAQPEDPFFEGMAFLGWFTDEMFASQYKFDQQLTADFTLYAKWSPFVSGFGGITFSLNSAQTGYTVVSVNDEAIAVKIDNFYQNKPVVSIGSGAFSNNQRLQIVILPNTLVTIGANAFAGCVNLRKADIPESVTAIGDNAFSGCVRLETVNFPETSQLLTIGSYAFSGAAVLTGIKLPITLTTIGTGAFYQCRSLFELEVPRSVSSIGANAFENCIGLKYAMFEKISPCALGANAFSGLSASFRIYVPDTLAYTTGVSVNWQALASKICSSAQTVSGWYYEIIKTGAHSGKLKLLHYLGSATILTVPASLTVAGVVRTVYSFGDNLFDNKVTVFKMNSDMPLSVNTFGAASGLVRLEMSIIDSFGVQRELLNSNMTIIRTAYETIDTLKEFSVSAIRSLKSLFGNVLPPANLKKVYILPDTTVLPAEMFYDCHSIEEVIIPATITVIGDRAFYSCFDLKTVTFAAGSELTHIGSGAFENCVGLESVDLPDTVNEIDSNAFKATPFVENSIEDYVVLGDGILYKYNGNEQIVILPKEIKQINEYAFYGATLRSFMFETGSALESVGQYAFAECVNLEHAAFPAGTDVLGEGAFYNDIKLSKVIFFFSGTGGAHINISTTTKIFANTMSSLEVYVHSAEKENYLQDNNNWETIVASQLGLSSWTGLRGAGLSYYGDWLFDYSVNGIALIQYFGSDVNIDVPDTLNNGAGQISNVIKLNNYVFPRATRSIGINASLLADPKVFGGLSSLTEVTLRNVTSGMPAYQPDPEKELLNLNHYIHEYVLGMLNANRLLATLNVGGQMSISALCGGLPPATLTTVNIFEEETALAANMFRNCVYITNINLPSAITYVGEHAFDNSGWERNYQGDFVIILRDLDGRGLLVSYKGNDQYVTLPSDVKEINRNLFEGNNRIEILEMSDVSVIHDYAFKGALRLNKIFIAGDAPECGADVFLNLINGTLLYVDADKTGLYSTPSTVTVLANDLITFGNYLLHELTPSTFRIVQYIGTNSSVDLPAQVGGYNIVSIGPNALYSSVTVLSFSASNDLDIYTFGNLNSLVSVTVYDTSVIVFNREYLFNLLDQSPSLAKLSYNGGDCTLVYLLNGHTPPASLKTVEVLSGSTEIVDNMLDDCPGINNIILPATIETIGIYAFEETAWYAAQPNYIVIVNGYLYKYKGTDLNATIPATVKAVGVRAFSQLTSEGIWQGNQYMRSVKFASGSSATAILGQAFYYCTLLQKFDAPSSLNYIASDAFENSGITNENGSLITIGDKGDVLIMYGGSEENYTLPAGITIINAGAFKNNETIRNLIIPSDGLLVSIGSEAFSGCSKLEMVWLDSIADGNQVTLTLDLNYIESIGKDAFSGTIWYNGLGKFLFGNGMLLLACSQINYMVLSDSDVPSGFELKSISGAAYASSAANVLYVDMTSLPTLKSGALDSLTSIYVASEMYNMYTAQWSAYTSKLRPAKISDGTFVDENGVMIYVNRQSDIVALTDRCGLSLITADSFNYVKSSGVKLVLTQYTPPSLEGSCLGIVSEIWVPSGALAAYQSAWNTYSLILNSYTVTDGFYVVEKVLYQYLGSSLWVDVPDGVESIAGYAFSAADNIQYLHLPESTITAATNAHVGLSNAVVGTAAGSLSYDEHFMDTVLALHTSVPAQTVSDIASNGETVIRYLGNGSEYTMLSAMKQIAVNAFNGHDELYRIYIHSTVTNIAANAFKNCENAILLVFSETIPVGFATDWNADTIQTYYNYIKVTEAYGDYIVIGTGTLLLKAAAGLDTISLSYAGEHKVTGIAANAFLQSPSIRKIYLSTDIVTVNSKSFAGCSSAVVYLNAGSIPATFASGWSAEILEYYTSYAQTFVSNGFRYVINGSAAMLLGYEGSATSVTIPGNVVNLASSYQVTAIGAYAFYNNTTLTSVTFLTQLGKIGEYAFSGCSSLVTVIWSNSINSIGAGAFAGTPWLASRTGWVSSAGKGYLYAGASNIAFVPSGITSIISGAFSSGGVRYAVFTSAVPISIAVSSFSGLQKVLVPAAYLNAYRSAANWSNYASIIDSYTELNGALYYHGALLSYEGTEETFEIPTSAGGYTITEIMDGAFAGNTVLKILSLGENIAVVGSGVFTGCDHLVIHAVCDTSGFAANWSGSAMDVYDCSSTYVNNGAVYAASGEDVVLIRFLPGYSRIEVPADVDVIASWAYLGSDACIIILPDTAITADPKAFSGADNLVLIAGSAGFTYAVETEIGEIYKGGINIQTDGDYTVFVENGEGTLLAYTGTEETVEIPASVSGVSITGIAGYAFLAGGVKTVLINQSVSADNISDNAFVQTGAETVVYYLSNIAFDGYEWASRAFEVHNLTKYSSSDYSYAPFNGGVLITEYTGAAAQQIVIPSKLAIEGVQLDIKGIASGAFDAFDAATRNIVIPSTVVFIGKNAFSGAQAAIAVNAMLLGVPSPDFAEGWNRYFSDTFYRFAGDMLELNGIVYLADGASAAVVGSTGVNQVKLIEKTVVIGGISRSVTKIASFAFADCGDNAHIFIPNSVVYVRDAIAYGTQNTIISLALPMIAASWHADTWMTTGQIRLSATKVTYNGLVLLRESGELTVIRYDGTASTVEVPAAITVSGISYNVTGIGPYAFYNNNNIYRLVLPASIQTAEENAFAGCNDIVLFAEDASTEAAAWLTTPADFKYVYYDIATLYTKDGFRYLLGSDFSAHIVDYVGSDINIVIPNNFKNGDDITYYVTSIGVYAFAFMTNIRKITIHDQIVAAGPDAFMGTSNAVIDLILTVMPEWGAGWQGDVLSVNTDSSSTCEIGGFYYLLGEITEGNTTAIVTGHTNTHVTSLEIPASIYANNKNYTVTKIAEYAFYNFTSLFRVTFAAGSLVTEIGAYAFYNCNNMYEFGFTDQITMIGEKAFVSTLWYQNKIADGMVFGQEGTLRLYAGREEAVVFDAASEIDNILGGAFGTNTAAKYLIFLDNIEPVVNDHGFDTIERILVPADKIVSYKALWGFAADKIDAFSEVDGMLFYHNILLAMIDADKASLTVPEAVGGYEIDTIAAYADKTGTFAARDLRVPATITAIRENSFPTSVVYYSAAVQPAGYGVITALAQYYNADNIFTEGGAQYSLIGGRATLVKYVGTDAEFSVPASVTHNGVTYTVNAAGAYSFAGSSTSGLYSVFVPASVSIHDNAFYTSSAVPAFVIYSALPQGSYSWAAGWEMPVYFGVNEVFEQSSLRYILRNGEITITQNITNQTQSGIVIPQTVIIGTTVYDVVAVGDYAFAASSSIASVTIPATVRYIGKNAFLGTSWLLHAGILIIDNHRLLLYNGTEDIVKLDESLGIREIVGGAFLSSTAKRVIIIGDTPLIELCDGAFDGIDLVTVPGIALDIYKDSLWSDNSMIIAGEVVVGEFGYALRSNNKLTVTGYYGVSDSITVPGSVLIGGVSYQVNVPDILMEGYHNYLWSGYKANILNKEFVVSGFGYTLTQDGIVTVTHFYGGSVSEVPSSVSIGGISYRVTALGANLYKDRTNITAIYLSANIVAIGADTFKGCVNATLYLTVASIDWEQDWDSDLAGVIYNYIG